jgi:hypothetical protein
MYLGCLFAPMLLFFAISGIWQTLNLHSTLLNHLATIHTSHQLKTKSGDNLTNAYLRIFVVLMAVSFIITTVLGVIMAIKYGRSRRAAIYCLAFGLIFPGALILLGILL